MNQYNNMGNNQGTVPILQNQYYPNNNDQNNQNPNYPQNNNYGNNNTDRTLSERINGCFMTIRYSKFGIFCENNPKIVKAVLFIAFLLFLILLPLSFHAVEYNEYAFSRSSINKVIDWEEVYEMGNHYWGVGYETFKFPRTRQRIDLKNTEIKASSGMPFHIDIVIWYKLDKNKLKDLYAAFGIKYDDQIVRLAIGAIKNSATMFTFEQYFTERSVIQDYIEKEVRKVFEENYVILPIGNFIMQDMRYGDNELIDKYLQTAIQKQELITAEYVQQQNEIQLETDYMVSLYHNNASQIEETTATEVETIVKIAESEAFNMKESAKGAGLRYFLDRINVTDPVLINEVVRTMTYLEKHPQLVVGDFNFLIDNRT